MPRQPRQTRKDSENLPYLACVEAFKKCKECDADKAGIWERRDCGCVWEIEMGRYSTPEKARLAAIAFSRRKGTTLEGRMNGNWTVEGPEGIIEAGSKTTK